MHRVVGAGHLVRAARRALKPSVPRVPRRIVRRQGSKIRACALIPAWLRGVFKKAWSSSTDKLAAVSDPYTALSPRLQDAFGLRRKESIKLHPTWADRGDVLHLKASWTEGDKERDIPIRAVVHGEPFRKPSRRAARAA